MRVDFPRLPPHANVNAFTMALVARRAAGQKVIDLTISNPTCAGFRYPEAELRAALAEPSVLAYHPDPRGSRAAREAIAAHHGHGADPEAVHLCASTSEAYGWLFKLHAAPGDEVLVPVPSYPLFEHLAALEGLSTRSVPNWFHDRWHLDPEALEAACTARTRIAVVVNPNNPTGHFLTRKEWRDLTSLCARRGLALIVDEVFADFALEPSADCLTTALEDPAPPCPVYVLSGLSKTALLPQVKLGWILSRGPDLAARLDGLDFIADQCLSVSASAQAAAPAIFGFAPLMRAQALDRARANVAALDAALAAHPDLARLPVEGGWSVLLRRPRLEDDEACALRLLEAGVLVHPGHFFDLPQEGCLVLSLLTAPDGWREGLSRMLPALRA